ncbi:choice-of-anchor L domain-containing protein [Pricia sp. S334]|uniref:Choice-of-anchor L domain-containing protein n=1 Tax=Pricia mediterranea TaxID=3076079 RepID=A0ABU3L7Q5_9FLAO|nr:choice-of-anchor L domain-containing protein [Pricia sp. S334]MDT7829717.1 choice-of-anchor L domain-containing protein [Pricia sp. S334]
MKIGILVTTIFTVGSHALFGQILVDDTNYTVAQLVSDVLINSNCAETSNYTSFTGTQQNINGIGYFNANNTDFPFEEGIVLSTGRARDARGPNTDINDSGTESWPGDEDLMTITKTGNLFNATFIQFDFVPLTNNISFNFLFASEEYQENYQCIYSDVFAFILTDAQGVSTNLALVPGTDQPVRATTIRPGVAEQCAARNLDFFGQINGDMDAISFEGQTESLKAESRVTPGETYTIKLVISDNQDPQVDSAVFLEAGSFSVGFDLGEDRTVDNGNPACIDEPIPLDATIEGVQRYRWYKDGSEIAAWTDTPKVALTESGTYRVDLIFSASCVSSGGLQVDFIAPPEIGERPADLTGCDIDGDGSEIFDLSANGAIMMGAQDPAIYAVTYFKSDADARAYAHPIENPDTYETRQSETIYARLSSGNSCYEITAFVLNLQALDFEASLPTSHVLCLDNNDGLLGLPPVLDTGLSPSEYNFTWYANEISEDNRIAGATGPSLSVSSLGTYHVRLQNLEVGCQFFLTTEVLPSRQPDIFEVRSVSDTFANNNTVEITAEGEGTYLYAVDDSEFAASNRFENLGAEEHTAYITDSENCSVLSKKFTIVDFPRFFTPNGDGINDVWRIVGFPEIEQAEITIFDQYGTMLYQFNDRSGWDGTAHDRNMPANDYWFKITYVKDNVHKEFKSHFTLKR